MTHFSHIFPLWMESTTMAWRQEYLVMSVLGCTEQLGRPVLDGLRQAAGRRRSLGSSSTHRVSFHHSGCFLNCYLLTLSFQVTQESGSPMFLGWRTEASQPQGTP